MSGVGEAYWKRLRAVEMYGLRRDRFSATVSGRVTETRGKFLRYLTLLYDISGVFFFFAFADVLSTQSRT